MERAIGRYEEQRRYEMSGVMYSVPELKDKADEKGNKISNSTLYNRLNSKLWTVEEAITVQVGKDKADLRETSERIASVGQKMCEDMLDVFYNSKSTEHFKKFVELMIEKNPLMFLRYALMPLVKEYGETKEIIETQKVPLLNLAFLEQPKTVTENETDIRGEVADADKV